MMGIHDDRPPELPGGKPRDIVVTPPASPLRIPCRIHGLTSDAGKGLNGQTGHAKIAEERLAALDDSERVPVVIEGAKAAKSLKRANLELAAVTRHLSGAGACTVTLSPFGKSSVSYLSWSAVGPTSKKLSKFEELEAKSLPFESLDELPVVLQFLLACGPVADLEGARASLGRIESPELLLEHADADAKGLLARRPPPHPGQHAAAGTLARRPPDLSSLVSVDVPACTTLSAEVLGSGIAGLGQLRAPGVGLTALEWAARCGNASIVDWLCTDPRTAPVLVKTGSPVGWACCAGHAEVARALLGHGASPLATDVVLWRGMPPILAAAANGQVETVQLLCEEQGVSIHTCDEDRLGILHHIHGRGDWVNLLGHLATDTYARTRGAKLQVFRNFTPR